VIHLKVDIIYFPGKIIVEQFVDTISFSS